MFHPSQLKLFNVCCETSLPIKVMKTFSPVTVNYQTKFSFIPHGLSIFQLIQFSVYLEQNKTKHTYTHTIKKVKSKKKSSLQHLNIFYYKSGNYRHMNLLFDYSFFIGDCVYCCLKTHVPNFCCIIVSLDIQYQTPSNFVIL